MCIYLPRVLTCSIILLQYLISAMWLTLIFVRYAEHKCILGCFSRWLGGQNRWIDPRKSRSSHRSFEWFWKEGADSKHLRALLLSMLQFAIDSKYNKSYTYSSRYRAARQRWSRVSWKRHKLRRRLTTRTISSWPSQRRSRQVGGASQTWMKIYSTIQYTLLKNETLVFVDDVVAEFQSFKKSQEEAEQPKDICTALPGWGDWGGEGIVMSKRKKSRCLKTSTAQKNHCCQHDLCMSTSLFQTHFKSSRNQAIGSKQISRVHSTDAQREDKQISSKHR